MKCFLFLIIIFVAQLSRAQKPQENTIVFEGFIFSEDSVPIENAHLINYRTTKIITTDIRGYFKTVLYEGDSLMINHISLAPKVVHANSKKSNENIILASYRTYLLSPISNNDFKREQKFSEQNMKQINKQLGNKTFRDTIPKTMNVNPYNDAKISQGIDFRGLLKLVRKLKKKK